MHRTDHPTNATDLLVTGTFGLRCALDGMAQRRTPAPGSEHVARRLAARRPPAPPTAPRDRAGGLPAAR